MIVFQMTHRPSSEKDNLSNRNKSESPITDKESAACVKKKPPPWTPRILLTSKNPLVSILNSK